MERQYGEFAYVYDRLMEEVDYLQWITHIESVFERAGITPKKLVELACGTGNITIPLAKRGYQMMGIDISEDMLMVAREKSLDQGADVLLIQQDICQLELAGAYEAILCLCDGVNYILDTEGLLGAFQSIYRHLSPGGVFLFDISSSYKLREILGNHTFGENQGDLCYLWENYFDESQRVIDMNLTFFIQENKLFRKFEELHRQRAYEIQELESLLRISGFEKIQYYDGFSWNRPREDSQRILFICQR